MAIVWREKSGLDWLRSEKIRNINAGRHKPNRKIKSPPESLKNKELDKLGPRGNYECPEESLLLGAEGGVVIPQGGAIIDSHDHSCMGRPSIRFGSDFPDDGYAVDWVRASRGQGNGRECSYWVWVNCDARGGGGFKIHGDQESYHHKARVTNLGPGGRAFWLISPSHSCVLDTCAAVGFVPKGDSEEFTTPDGKVVRVKVPARGAVGFFVGGAHTSSSVIKMQNCYSHNVQYGTVCPAGVMIDAAGDRMEDVALPYRISNVDRVSIRNFAFNQSCGRDGLLGEFHNVRQLEFSGIIDRALFKEAHILVDGTKHIVTTRAHKIGVIDWKLGRDS